LVTNSGAPKGGKADAPREFVLQTTKTRAGERTLTLDPDLLRVLQEHRANQDEERALLGEHWRGPWGDLVFTTDTGAPIHISILRRHFQRVLQQAELPPIRFHDLRHTAATLMLADGIPLITVSKILGHSSPVITAMIYAHALDESKSGAIAGLSQRLQNGDDTHNSHHNSHPPKTEPAPPNGKRGLLHTNAGAEDGTRTRKTLRSAVFKTAAFAISPLRLTPYYSARRTIHKQTFRG
jgi:hypothetical protein